jgi:peptidoglycan L-alanyl-D-glutamate endopeptidase CwlK
MNTSSEARLQQVNPALAAKIHALAAQLLTEGIVIIVMQGMRTWAEQDALYAQGRTTPGKIVTNAKGGQSYHNLGCAVDCAPLIHDTSVDWNANHPQWKRMEELGVSLGLVSGANWVRLVDAPHFQLTGRFPVGAPNDEARQLFQQSPETLWNEINKP